MAIIKKTDRCHLLRHRSRKSPCSNHPSYKLIALSTRGQTAEARQSTILQPVEGKPHSQIDKMKRQRTLYQMKEQGKTAEKQLNEVEIGNLPEKEFGIMIVKMIQDVGKKWRQRSRRCKKCLTKT